MFCFGKKDTALTPAQKSHMSSPICTLAGNGLTGPFKPALAGNIAYNATTRADIGASNYHDPFNVALRYCDLSFNGLSGSLGDGGLYFSSLEELAMRNNTLVSGGIPSGRQSCFSLLIKSSCSGSHTLVRM
jgi:hypothetical protein